MNTHDALIRKFYTAFQQKDFLTMQSCYHPEATFSDPVFQNLSSKEVKAMWQMLLTASKDLKVTFDSIQSDGDRGRCHWEAWYSFSRTGRAVHNVIDASMEFKDGLIYRHNDRFDFWKWSRQALGTTGLFLGWTPIVGNKVRGTAQKSLKKFMTSN
jgi:ketosteroid isomerase-like protein